MKKLLLVIALLAAPALTSCHTPPSARVNQVETLKSIGLAVDGAMKISAQLLNEQRITSAQWYAIADLHDRRFLPAYRLAVSAVRANLDSVASPDLSNLASELLTLVQSYAK